MNKGVLIVKQKLWRVGSTIQERVTKNLLQNNKGMGVVEIILIILVLVSLAVIFKSRITSIVNSVFTKISSKVNTI